MRSAAAIVISTLLLTTAAFAQQPDADAKKNANPCRDEVSAALQKLRNSSWFRMETSMITENGPTQMQVDYVLPDRMHQKVSVLGQQTPQEVILVGKEAWSNEGDGWRTLPADITEQLIVQMQDSVVLQQKDIGNYSCKGRSQLDGKDVLTYKLEDEVPENSNGTRNEAFRLFYVDVMTGLPVRNAIVAPGREDKPIFKTSYSFPLDLKIDPPKDPKPLNASPPSDGGSDAGKEPAKAP